MPVARPAATGTRGYPFQQPLSKICRCKDETSLRAQSRDDTLDRRTPLVRNGMSAKRWVRARGQGSKPAWPVRGFAQPLEALAAAQHHDMKSAVGPPLSGG